MLRRRIITILTHSSGSAEEIEDLKNAYLTTDGSLGEMMTYIPHSAHEDEPRFVIIINDLIKKKELKKTTAWTSSSKDEKGKQARKKRSEKEAKEAEAMAKELGVWNEFYGDGKPSDRKKTKGKGKATEENTDDDHSALQALILKKKQKDMDGFLDSFAAKYSEPVPKAGSRSKARKRADEEAEEGVPSKKKSRVDPPPPEIDDAEFAKLQEKLFGDKSKASSNKSSTDKKASGRKAK